jgi:hypothetical protein
MAMRCRSRPALNAHARRRRIGEAALDGGDVAEPEQAAAGLDADFANAVDRLEIAGDADAHAVGRRLVETGRGHRILLPQRVEDGQRIEAERRQLGVRHLDVDLLVLHADQLDLLDVGHLPQFARRCGRPRWRSAARSKPSPVSA